MFVAIHTIRRIVSLAVVLGSVAVLAPVAQADAGFQGSPDAIDRAVAARQAELAGSFNGSPDAIDRAVVATRAAQDAAFDTREHAALRLPPAGVTSSDVIERAVRAHEREAIVDLSGMPDVVERAAAAGELTFRSETTSAGGFDWRDFGIGAGAGVGVMALLGLGVGLLIGRHGNRQMTTA
jgi:hypothetical protein